MFGVFAGKGNKNKQVRSVLFKQFSILIFVLAIAIWQRHFVMQAASADVYIFALLLSAGVFGIYTTVKGTFGLGKDFLALEAIKELHEDTRRKVHAPRDHEIIVRKRLESVPIVYTVPKSLGTAHNLLIEEMLRTDTLRISPQTMQVLAHDLEAKLDGRRELAHYLGAIMVLLGLLGTFIGLMHTLESVGGILGSLNVSESAGSGAIAALIESLKRPLEGMATGFGASLFGLIGSLLIGVMSRIDSTASNRLLHEFESWIGSVVQMDGSQARNEEGEGTVATNEPNANNWRVMFRVARSTVQTTSKMAEQIGVLAASIETLRDSVAVGDTELRKDISSLTLDVQRLIAAQSSTGISVENLNYGLAESHERVSVKLTQISDLLDASNIQNYSAAKHLQTELENLRSVTFQSAEYAAENHALLKYVDGKITALQMAQRDEAQVPSAQAEIDDLVANLDHLIAASRLNPDDVARLRHLSAVVESMAAGEAFQQSHETYLNALMGVAK